MCKKYNYVTIIYGKGGFFIERELITQQIEYEFGLNEMIQILKRRWIIIVIISVSLTLLFPIISFFTLTPTYKTSTLLGINNIENINLNLSSELITMYNDTIKSDKIVNIVISELNLKLSKEELKSNISISPVQNGDILEISLLDKNPEMVISIANTISRVFCEEINVISGTDTLFVIDTAKKSTSLMNQNILIDITIAGIFGLCISMGTVFILDFTEYTDKIKDNLKQYFSTYGIKLVLYKLGISRKKI